MKAYFLKRLLAIIPTFFGITILAFVILNLAPGGPVEQMIRQIRFGSPGNKGISVAGKNASLARDTGVNEEIIKAMQKQYGFDKPIIINLRIEDARVGGIDAISEAVFALDHSPESVSMKKLHQFGTLILPYLIPALLSSNGSDAGLIDLISDNGLQTLKKNASAIIGNPPISQYQHESATQMELINSERDLLNLALHTDIKQRLDLLRTARILESLRIKPPLEIEKWNWNNPISKPFLDFLSEYTGKDAVQSADNLKEWWQLNAHFFAFKTASESVDSFEKSPSDQQLILRHGQFAVSAIIQKLASKPELAHIYIPLLETLTHHQFISDLTHFEIQHALDAVTAWWEENSFQYREIGFLNRVGLAFTYTRYGIWLKNILTFDFGQSFTYDQPVMDVILSKMPVSIQFGVMSFFATYLVCIPLGIWKAVKDGTAFDYSSSIILFLMWSIPGFMLAVLLIVFFGGGSFFNLIPIGGLYSDNYFDLNVWQKIIDRIHHFIAPLICYMIAEFTTLTLLMKNSIIEEIAKDYCRTARAKGLDNNTVYLKHALRNALIPIATGIGGFLGIFFAGSMLLEMIFNLDGMGLLGYTSVLSRDFNVIMGDLVLISFITLIGNIISDFIYTIVDPRIDFA